MKKNRIEIKEKLYKLGRTVGLEANEINFAKVTIKSRIFTLTIVIIFSLIGLFSSRLETVGLWYTVVSIKDFGLLSSFF
jgi:hypothetical protein